MYPRNHKLKDFANILRKNMTLEEKHLWYDFFLKAPHRCKATISHWKLYCWFLRAEKENCNWNWRCPARIARQQKVRFWKRCYPINMGNSCPSLSKRRYSRKLLCRSRRYHEVSWAELLISPLLQQEKGCFAKKQCCTKFDWRRNEYTDFPGGGREASRGEWMTP